VLPNVDMFAPLFSLWTAVLF